MNNLVLRKTSMSEQILQFCQYLRQNKFTCGIEEEKDVFLALSRFIPVSQADFCELLKLLLVKNKNQFLRFEDLFHTYFQELSRAENAKQKKIPEKSEQTARPQVPSLLALKDWLFDGRAQDSEALAQASGIALFVQKDFSQFKDTDLDSLQGIVRRLSKKLAQKEHRRFQKTNKRKWLDLRRTFHQNIRKGRGVEQFYFKKRKISKLKITILCDVSKSMDLYARFLLQFLYSFHQVSAKISSFVFSTSLTHISPQLEQEEFDQCLNQLQDTIQHWSGGTNIGKCLEDFKCDFGDKYLDKKTTVVFLSDGWDVGDPEILTRQMRYLSKKSNKLIWINPLAGNENYKVETAGMKAAMPFVDVFASAHNLDTLMELVNHLR